MSLKAKLIALLCALLLSLSMLVVGCGEPAESPELPENGNGEEVNEFEPEPEDEIEIEFDEDPEEEEEEIEL